MSYMDLTLHNWLQIWMVRLIRVELIWRPHIGIWARKFHEKQTEQDNLQPSKYRLKFMRRNCFLHTPITSKSVSSMMIVTFKKNCHPSLHTLHYKCRWWRTAKNRRGICQELVLLQGELLADSNKVSREISNSMHVYFHLVSGNVLLSICQIWSFMFSTF